MGLPAPTIKYILKIVKDYGIKRPVCTLGNQDIYATEKDMIRWIKESGLALNIPSVIVRSTSREAPQINKEGANFIHAKTFFEFLGIPKDQYYDIDKFEFDQPVILQDLEKPIEARYRNFFNFVLDGGTMEHIFDIKQVMSNIVYITKVGGYVLQLLPAQNCLNHGFYQFSPTFFYDFYISNGFEIVESHIIQMRGNVFRFYSYNQKRDYLGLFFNSANRMLNCFLVRKTSDVQEIKSPTQYLYKKVAEGAVGNFHNTFLDKAVSLVRKIIPFRFHGMFFKLWTFLKRLEYRRDYFDIKP